MKNKSNLLFKWLLFTILIQAVVTYIFFGLIYLPGQKYFIFNSLSEKLKNTAIYYFPLVTKSIETKNDLATINYLQEILKDPELINAQVLDLNGKITAHSNIQDWGKTPEDETTKSIIANTSACLNNYTDKYIYSIPLVVHSSKTAVFAITASKEKANASYSAIKNKTAKSAVVFFVVTAAVYVAAFYVLFILPLKQLRKRIESAALGQSGEQLQLKRNDEIGTLADSIDKLIQKSALEKH
ncbi:MAG: hypothetical protein A2252_01570 [Elusimicrobia bacterium RIFOXYA2_FULL_39_19]|nr:MAG: hypothetical protein A2252_01570 [Elusimicrobia bacterium RIFOXYA2_FULL_39_19]